MIQILSKANLYCVYVVFDETHETVLTRMKENDKSVTIPIKYRNYLSRLINLINLINKKI